MSDVLSQGPLFLASLIFMLGVVVIVHELGHYWAGRLFGAAVESFSVGFGRPIFERTDSRGTRWRVNWIPIGGFVKFVGEAQLPSDVGQTEQGPIGAAYPTLGVGARSVVSIAGPAANFLLAIVVFAVLLMAQGRDLHRVSLTEISPDGPAAQAGLQAGDIVESIDGKAIENYNDFIIKIRMNTGVPLDFGVRRNDAALTVAVTPERGEVDNGLGQIVRVGMIRARPAVTQIGEVRYGPLKAVAGGVEETGDTIAMTGRMLGRMLTGREPISNLSGPVGIGDTTRRVVNRTLGAENAPLGDRVAAMAWTMLRICALVSIGIGLFNLLPLPILDGGHLVFNAYEAIAGRALPEKVQEASLMAGLVFLIGVAIIVTIGDILETGIFGA